MNKPPKSKVKKSSTPAFLKTGPSGVMGRGPTTPNANKTGKGKAAGSRISMRKSGVEC